MKYIKHMKFLQVRHQYPMCMIGSSMLFCMAVLLGGNIPLNKGLGCLLLPSTDLKKCLVETHCITVVHKVVKARLDAWADKDSQCKNVATPLFVAS